MDCCDATGERGYTRREVLGVLAGGLVVLGGGGFVLGRSSDRSSVPGTTWRRGSPAPFSRHAHSGAALRGRLLVMGGRRSWKVQVTAAPPGEPQATIEVVAGKPGELQFDAQQLDVPGNVPVRIVFINEGNGTHDFSVISANVNLVASPGQTVEGVAVFTTPDTFFCSVDGHATAGMIGDLLVDGVEAADRSIDESSGSTDMWWFDPSTGDWEEAPTLPHSLNHVSFVSVGDRVYSIGGFPGNIGVNPSPEVWAYDPDNDEWRRMGDMPIGRASMACTTDGERIICTGGRSEPEGTPSATDVFVYDPASDTWSTPFDPMPTGRDHVAAAYLDGVVWVMGGRGTGERLHSTPVAEGLDLATGTWIKGKRLPTPESAGGVATLAGRIVVFGGEGPAPTPAGAVGQAFTVWPDVEAYDPSRDEWEHWSPLPVAVHHPAYDVVDGVLVSVGGGVVSGVSETSHTQLLAL